MFKFLFFFVIVLISVNVHAQEIGFPIMRNYDPKEYNSSSQVFAVIQDEKGLIYLAMASGGGVIQYDGQNWTYIQISNKTSAYSFARDNKNVVYVGANNDLGYLKSNFEGKKEFISLKHLIQEKDLKFGAVWWASYVNNKIYFCSFDALFEYSPLPNPSIKTYLAGKGNRFSGLSVREQDIYVYESNKGLLKFDKDRLVLVSDFFKDKRINTILPFSADSFLIATTNQGLFFYEPKTTKTQIFAQQPSDFLTGNDISFADILPDKSIALGSFRNGILAISKNGKIMQAFNEKSGLLDNTTRYIYTDANQNLWFGLNNGLSRSSAAFDLSFFGKNSGLQGAVLDLANFENQIYIATYLGLFYLENNQIKQIENIPTAQCWSLLPYTITEKNGKKKEVLLLGSSAGIFQIENKKAKLIIKSGNAFKLRASKKNPNRIYGSDQDNFISFQYKNGTWIDEGKYEGIKDRIYEILEDSKGNLWLGTYSGGVIRLELDQNTNKSTKVKLYTEIDGLPSLRTIYPYFIKEKIVFGTEKGLYIHNPKTDRFEVYCELSNLFCDGKQDILNISEMSKGQIWVLPFKNKTQNIGYLNPNKNGTYDWIYKPFRRIPQTELSCVLQDSNGVVWLGASEGVFRYDSRLDTKNYEKEFYTLIRKVSIGEDSVIYHGNNENVSKLGFKDISYSHNSIFFEYAAPFFDDESKTVYSYILEGFDKHWSSWTKDSKKEYTNLREGNYVFKVKAKNLYDTESIIATYQISILPPWQRNAWAYLFYVVVIVGVFRLFIRWNTSRLIKEKEYLEEKITERTAEVRQQNMEIQQQKEEIESSLENLKTANVEIQQQKEELLSTAENLKVASQEIQNAYNDIRILSEIGQKITSSLHFESISDLIYKNVNELMDASVFGIGIYHAEKKQIEYKYAIEKGQHYKPYFRSMRNKNQFPVWCIENKKHVFINNVFEEYSKYIAVFEQTREQLEDGSMSDIATSLVYVPLMVEQEVLGIMTVQSFSANAYDQQHLTMLKTLGAYIAIAIENSKNYEIIQTANQSITDSIRYAKTIQHAILPDSSEIKQFLKDYFVLFHPKDLVSGDFYWFTNVNLNGRSFSFISAIDCTGHGVPGGFMSMIAYSMLNELVNENKIIEPKEILKNLDQRIRIALHQESKLNGDGMDLCMVRIEKQTECTKIVCAGAKRPTYVVMNKQIQEMKATKRSIGGFQVNKKDFEQEELEIRNQAMIYLFTDGLPDQNNKEDQKIGTKPLLEILLANSDLPCEQQLAILEKTLSKFKGNTKQRDDITVIGVLI